MGGESYLEDDSRMVQVVILEDDAALITFLLRFSCLFLQWQLPRKRKTKWWTEKNQEGRENCLLGFINI